MQWRIQAGARRPPYGSRFFRFDIQIFRNVAASGVGAPPYEVGAPPTGNPGSATGMDSLVPDLRLAVSHVERGDVCARFHIGNQT